MPALTCCRPAIADWVCMTSRGDWPGRLQCGSRHVGLPAGLQGTQSAEPSQVDCRYPAEHISCPVPLQVNKQLSELGLSEEAAEKVWDAISVDSLEGLDTLLGEGHPSADELRRMWALAEGYGYQEWLQLDLGIVRGLAYYTGGLSAVPVRCGAAQSAAQELRCCWALGLEHCVGRNVPHRWA